MSTRRNWFHPTMRALHHPPMCFETHRVLQRLGFFASCATMRWNPNSSSNSRTSSSSSLCQGTAPEAASAGASGRSTAMFAMVSRAILKSLQCAPSHRQTDGHAWVSLMGTGPGWKRAAARARSRCRWSKRFGLTRFSSRITGLASRVRISSPSRRKIRCRKFPRTKSVRRACRRRSAGGGKALHVL